MSAEFGVSRLCFVLFGADVPRSEVSGVGELDPVGSVCLQLLNSVGLVPDLPLLTLTAAL